MPFIARLFYIRMMSFSISPGVYMHNCQQLQMIWMCWGFYVCFCSPPLHTPPPPPPVLQSSEDMQIISSFHACIMNISVNFVAVVDFPNPCFCAPSSSSSAPSSRQTHIAFIIVIIITDSAAAICILIIIIIRDIIIITIATVRMAQSLPPPPPLRVNKVAVIHFFMALTVFITPQ